MTATNQSYSGVRTITYNDRLYEFVRDISVFADAFIIASEAIVRGKAKGSPSGRVEILCHQFGVNVILPTNGALRWAMAPKRPKGEFDISFSPIGFAQNRAATQWTSDGVMGAFNYPFIGGFILFYEHHSPWIRKMWPKGPATYPGIFKFGWMMRNALVHKGICTLRSGFPNSCTWHHLSFSAADAGKVIFPTVVGGGEIIVLAIEMSAELDRLECPLGH